MSFECEKCGGDLTGCGGPECTCATLARDLYKGPAKIWIESPTNQRTLPDRHRIFHKNNVEYIRSDLVLSQLEEPG